MKNTSSQKPNKSFRVLALILSINLVFFLSSCGSPKTDTKVTQEEVTVDVNAQHATESKDIEKTSIEVNPNNNAYFGNVHIHTSWSFDAYINGSATVPDDAYRWAKGEAIDDKRRPEKLVIKSPLDFYAVSEHAEYLGIFAKMRDPNSSVSKTKTAMDIHSKDQSVAFKTYERIVGNISIGVAEPDLIDPTLAKSGWQYIADLADKHNQPGVFTAFPAFEWTSAPNGRNLHRVVLFKDSKNLPELPFSALDSIKPEDLWKYMDTQRDNGATLLAIPHNANASNGLMFSQIDSNGKDFDKNYVETRMRNEPLYEITQIKGTSETHPILSPNDEFADFEQWEYLISTPTPTTKFHGSYLRTAYLDGLEMDANGIGNPFKYGIIGDSDTHNAAATIEEDNYTGKFGLEHSPKQRLMGPLKIEARNKQVREFSSGGLAGVWAESNTREAIFSAMMRKETFGTTGPKIKVRMFGSWVYDKNILQSKDWLSKAYQQGVAMGGDLKPSKENNAPIFIITAQKDPNGANLDRIQVVKGWVENGENHEKIYNVKVSDDRKLNENGRPPAVGNTVDIKTASYTNTIGDAELSIVWSDPDFEPNQHSFFYARVLAIPTPRWSTYDAATMGIEPLDDLPVTIQERAWTSPIWYSPKKTLQEIKRDKLKV